MCLSPLQLFFCALGLAMVLEGMIYFLFPVGLKRFLENLQDMPPSFLRNMGFWVMVMGLIIIYFSM